MTRLRMLPTVEDRHHQTLWRACLAGQEPAESLSTTDRERLVMLLADKGWTYLDIALHTRLTEYTAERIRRRALAVRRAVRQEHPVSHLPLSLSSRLPWGEDRDDRRTA